MSDLIYKRIFEVRILHGYYLDHWYWSADNTPKIFQEYGPEEQAFVLENKYDVRQHFFVEPSESTQKRMKGLKIKWQLTPFGLLVGQEVVRSSGGSYLPRSSISADTRLTFKIRIRDGQLYNRTNHALKPTLPAYYYFSNIQDGNLAKEYPSLSVLPSPFNPERSWEMGEFARDNGVIRMARRSTQDINDLATISFQNWANTADRKALPKTFFYRFDAKYDVNQPVIKAQFTLLSPDGTIVKTIGQEYGAGMHPSGQRLDFQSKDKEAGQIQPLPIADGPYRLDVRINNLLFEQREILLRSDLTENSSVFGLLEIACRATDGDFSLLEADGSLRRRIQNGKASCPVFEIRVPARQTYWRYNFRDKHTMPAQAGPFDGMEYDGETKQLITTNPRRLTLTKERLTLTATSAVHLPTPDRPDLTYERKQYFSELYLSTLKLD